MAFESGFKITDYDSNDLFLDNIKIQGKNFRAVEKRLIAHTMREIDPQLSDGDTWVDMVAWKMVMSALGGTTNSAAMFVWLVRSFIYPGDAKAQNDYGELTRLFEEDLVGAAVLRHAIATIFWASVADKTRPYNSAATKASVLSAVLSIAPSFRALGADPETVAEDVVDVLDTEYSLDPDIDPEKIFRMKLPQP